MRFSLYGDTWQGIGLLELLQMQSSIGDLWAHAEDSGCESCYVEVARWNHDARQWQRYCFMKIDGWRFPDMPDFTTDAQTADGLARRINTTAWQHRSPIVHRMPQWTESAVAHV